MLALLAGQLASLLAVLTVLTVLAFWLAGLFDKQPYAIFDRC